MDWLNDADRVMYELPNSGSFIECRVEIYQPGSDEIQLYGVETRHRFIGAVSQCSPLDLQ